MNLHSLHHVVQYCRCYGPIWTTWCFPFEKALGIAKTFVHGKQTLEDQFAFAFQATKALQKIEGKHIKLPPQIPDQQGKVGFKAEDFLLYIRIV